VLQNRSFLFALDRDAYIERTRPEEKGNAIMGELWILIAIVAGWFVLNRYVLPKFGITT